jgi:hypothetical protein
MARRTHYTTDHEAIRDWSEEHRCSPAVEQLPHKGTHHFHDPLILGTGEKIDDTIHLCEWDEFFELFDDRGLVFAYEELDDGNCVHQLVEAEALREMGMEGRVKGAGRRAGGSRRRAAAQTSGRGGGRARAASRR